MTTKTMWEDLHAAQQEMPAIQATAINPAYRSRYVTLEELLDKVLPVLSAHNFVLIQQPTVAEGKPALRTVLMHGSGEVLESTMLLVDADTSQHHGAALTYARRYSLTAWLGLTADTDDDAQSTVRPPFQRPNAAPQRPVAARSAAQPSNGPSCPLHGPCRFQRGGVSKKSGKPYGSFWSCQDLDCSEGYNGKAWSIDALKWESQQAMERNTEPPMLAADFDEEMPFE